MMPARLSRRGFVFGGGTALLVACSRTTSGVRGAPPPVVVANHPVYVDAATNAGFTVSTGSAVEYHEEITDDGAWLASVEPRFARDRTIGRDVVVVADWVADRLSTSGWLAGPSVTWALNMVGIAYRSDAYRAGSYRPTRVTDLFREDVRGRAALPTDVRATFGMALLADRVDPATVTVDQMRATAGRLHNSVLLGQVLPFDGTRPLERLVNGEADVGVVVASEIVGHDELAFVVPDEGGLQLVDVAVIPTGAPNPTGAQRYLDYVADPVRVADRVRVVPVMWEPNDTVAETLRRDAPAVLDDPRRNPSAEVRARLHRFRSLSVQDDSVFTDLFHAMIRP